MGWLDKFAEMLVNRDREEDEDPFEEGGKEEESMSSRKKADVARDRILVRQGSGPEAEARYVRSAEYQIPKKVAEDEVERRRVRATLKRDYRLSDDEADEMLEKLGGVRGYYSGRVMVDETDLTDFKLKLKKMAEELKKRGIGLEEIAMEAERAQ